MVDADRIARARARLKSFRDSLPQWHTLPQKYVDEFHELISDLGSAGVDVRDFAVPDSALTRQVSSSNYITREVRYHPELHVERAMFLSRVDGLVEYLNRTSASRTTPEGRDLRFGSINITGGNVTFGDGSHINVTVADLLRAVSAQIDRQVEDPEAKKSLLGKVDDLLRHPASTSVLQAGLPELLRVLTGA